MGIRFTDKRRIAMYDSVSGFAFGPTFDSEEEAEDFLKYAQWIIALGLGLPRDLRAFNSEELDKLYSAWLDIQLNKHPELHPKDK